jgi:hypothetical protein
MRYMACSDEIVECGRPAGHQLVHILACVSLIAFTVVIGTGMLTAVAIGLQVIAPAALLCEAKSWLNQKCGPRQESTEVETAAEVVAVPMTEQPVQGSPQLIGAEQSREISVTTVALPQERSEARETQYNAASAQTEVSGSGVVGSKSITSDLDRAEQPLATEEADAVSKRPSPRPAGQETLRRPQAKRSDPRRSTVIARDTLHDVPVNISDGTQRRIDIRPTSLQDVYYYSARR